MIMLKDLFGLLATGEFSNIALSRGDTGGINESEYAKVIGHINLALIELHKRLKLLEGELLLSVDPTLEIYYLQDDRVTMGTPNKTRYIQLTTGQDMGLNIIEVTGIFDSLGNEMAINNRHTIPSIIQLSSDSLRITKAADPIVLSIVYQACPPSIILDDSFDLESIQLNIPSTIIEAILYYVASRVYRPTGANNSTANADKSIGYQQQYELACQKFELFGLGIQNCDRENKFENDGWA